MRSGHIDRYLFASAYWTEAPSGESILRARLVVRVAKADVEARTVQLKSIMPDGQEAMLSRREFVNVIAYLTTLK